MSFVLGCPGKKKLGVPGVPAVPLQRTEMTPTWRALARAKVLLEISDLGPERRDGTPTGRFGGREAFRRLEEGVGGDEKRLAGVHEVLITEAPGRPIAALEPRTKAGDPAIFRLAYTVARDDQGRPGLLSAPRTSRSR
ncbi:MAG: hypothetical protein HY815_13905 [Candidatus Riflebacteria bacterium]|nr:hypothetical protein [Candidatus Riflebacteria bacterium]